MDIICTPAAEHLDLDAHTLDRHPSNDSREFPDGEVYVQLERVASLDEALIVHSGAPDPNDGMMYLYGLLDLLAEHDVRTEVCLTYAPYSRQDASFFPGTLNYAESILHLLATAADHVHTIDAHFAPHDWTGQYPYTDHRALPHIQEQVAMDDYVTIGPDTGAQERFDLAGYDKERKSAYDVELTGAVDVDGRNVLVFDDLIATGSTMIEAHQRLKEQGAARIEAAAVHGILQRGIDRVTDAYDALHLTNAINRAEANVPIEPIVRDIAGR